MSDYNEFDDTSDMTEEECRQMLRIVGNERDALRGELAEARRDVAALRAALTGALELVEDWSAYAPDYFKQKWDLEGDLKRLQAAIGAARKETP